MATETEASRRNFSVPMEIAEKVDGIAAERHVSADRAVVDLLADAIKTWEERRTLFLALADRFQNSIDPAEIHRLRDEMANLTFGY